ncbi:MAG: hypothetical protein JW956_07780 [Calditrichaceae bacterium]|nr:hypothetical protein [Calditrichaceae bacterium]
MAVRRDGRIRLPRLLQFSIFGAEVPEKGQVSLFLPDLKACLPQAGKGYSIEI